jgi:hypothetical protein
MPSGARFPRDGGIEAIDVVGTQRARGWSRGDGGQWRTNGEDGASLRKILSAELPDSSGIGYNVRAASWSVNDDSGIRGAIDYRTDDSPEAVAPGASKPVRGDGPAAHDGADQPDGETFGGSAWSGVTRVTLSPAASTAHVRK